MAPDELAAIEAPVLVVMGVSGVGKTTVASALAERLGWRRAEGDDLHPAENLAKMASGVPLDDDDRWPWLARVREWIVARTEAGEAGIITCSALTVAYRDQLRQPSVIFVHLDGSLSVVGGRHAARSDHFMPSSLLASQFTALEPLRDDEQSISVGIVESPDAIADRIVAMLGLRRVERPLGAAH
ncbi:gluconokinase [Pseudoclavibacter sp. AY1F1]|uniref:gluconokinase n=1 Tax=Pseudoclavibacter sp. AY1F1 TaxID=2080583 RepID=UPI0021571C91|nr:gluconokinase [Pseudoclavibacter sp. AY1F1]